MRAVDTNILVRFVTRDDPAQAERARRVIAAGDLFVPVTVILETEWVLRSVYAFAPDRIGTVLRGLLDLDGVTVQHERDVGRALGHAAAGLQLADALHLCLAGGCTEMLTFDRSFRESAAAIEILTVVEP